MNKKLTLLAALALGGCAMATGSSMAQLQASSWQLQGATGDTFTLQVVDGKVAGKLDRLFHKVLPPFLDERSGAAARNKAPACWRNAKAWLALARPAGRLWLSRPAA